MDLNYLLQLSADKNKYDELRKKLDNQEGVFSNPQNGPQFLSLINQLDIIQNSLVYLYIVDGQKNY